MAPIRTHDTQAEASTSTKGNKHLNGRPKRHHPQSGKESATPGVSKIKSSLRQTRRLLAKDNLAANMRVETERRLRALETELAQAELANKEKAMATRYHKVKFFERQKVTRKINQTKKQLSSTTDGSTDKKLVKTLNDLRVDLNYILHYPKLKKYISLFPPEVRQDESGSGVAEGDAAKTAQAREEIRDWIRSSMEEGKLPREPELHPSSDTKHHSKRKEWEGSVASKKPTELKSKSRPALEERDDAIEQDEFFGDDDESDAS